MYRVPALCLILFFHSGYAQQTLRVKSITASIQGTSTLHDWESAITQIEFNGLVQSERSVPTFIKDILVKIPVKSIKSKEGKLMDSKTYDAFKSDSFPLITYTAAQAQITVDASQHVLIRVSGNLTMAGTTRPIQLEAKGKLLPDGDLQVSVSKTLKMTEFSMRPPTVMMGTIKVGDEVTVTVDLTLTNADTAHK